MTKDLEQAERLGLGKYANCYVCKRQTNSILPYCGADCRLKYAIEFRWSPQLIEECKG